MKSHFFGTSLEIGQHPAESRKRIQENRGALLVVPLREIQGGYARRVRVLIEQRVALWDVLAAATRSGSLDADIAEDAIPNNFRAFFNANSDIRLIGFNGATAAKLFERHLIPTLADAQRSIVRDTLPSTSAAHASLFFAKKAARWSALWSDAIKKHV